MNIPDINSQFEGMFAIPVANVEDALRRSGTPVFVAADIAESENFLDRFLRMIFVRKRITNEYLATRCRNYAINVLNIHPTKANSPGSNLLRALKKGDISQKRFNEALISVLGYRIEDMEFVSISERGERDVYRLFDPIDK